MITIKKNKIQIIIAVIGALIILTLIFIVYRFLFDIKNNSQKLISQNMELVGLNSKIKNLEESKDVYKDIEDISNKIDQLFINSDMPVDFITFLEKTANECYISNPNNRGFSYGTTGKNPEDPWTSTSFQINLIGPFNNVMRFLDKIENGPYLIQVQNLNLNKLGQGSSTSTATNFKADFSIKVFSKKK